MAICKRLSLPNSCCAWPASCLLLLASRFPLILSCLSSLFEGFACSSSDHKPLSVLASLLCFIYASGPLVPFPPPPIYSRHVLASPFRTHSQPHTLTMVAGCWAGAQARWWRMSRLACRSGEKGTRLPSAFSQPLPPIFPETLNLGPNSTVLIKFALIGTRGSTGGKQAATAFVRPPNDDEGQVEG